MKCTAVLNLTKADAIKAAGDIQRFNWQNNDTTANGTTFVIYYDPSKRKKYNILFKLGVNFARAYKGA